MIVCVPCMVTLPRLTVQSLDGLTGFDVDVILLKMVRDR